jgi:hypothetical protein
MTATDTECIRESIDFHRRPQPEYGDSERLKHPTEHVRGGPVSPFLRHVRVLGPPDEGYGDTPESLEYGDTPESLDFRQKKFRKLSL